MEAINKQVINKAYDELIAITRGQAESLIRQELEKNPVILHMEVVDDEEVSVVFNIKKSDHIRARLVIASNLEKLKIPE